MDEGQLDRGQRLQEFATEAAAVQLLLPKRNSRMVKQHVNAAPETITCNAYKVKQLCMQEHLTVGF